jgi:formylglycine-generating enzyme required for sulfatase activity
MGEQATEAGASLSLGSIDEPWPEGRLLVMAGAVREAVPMWLDPGSGRTRWFADEPDGPEMVVVPAGIFVMGSPGSEVDREAWQRGTESPLHEVAIERPFAVSRFAITRGQFARFVDDTAHRSMEGAYVWSANCWTFDRDASWVRPGFAQTDDHPVVCVSRHEAEAYAGWLSDRTGQFYRLLTEAEWEYVARAGTSTPYWWGNSISPTLATYHVGYGTDTAASVFGCHRATVPVDAFDPNPWGLFNIHGNVWEWCEDPWHDSYRGAPQDGSPWPTRRTARFTVARGGCWSGGPSSLRAACRGRYRSELRYAFLGFRLARDLPF